MFRFNCLTQLKSPKSGTLVQESTQIFQHVSRRYKGSQTTPDPAPETTSKTVLKKSTKVTAKSKAKTHRTAISKARKLPAKPSGNTLAFDIFQKNNFDKRKGSAPVKGDRTRLNIVNEDLCGLYPL
jgi:hypothetical protein